MHDTGNGKMIFGDCIALRSILASFEVLPCDSLLSATKATPFLWKQLCLPSAQNRYHTASLLTRAGLLVSGKGVPCSQKTGRRKKPHLAISRPPSDNYLIVAFSLWPTSSGDSKMALKESTKS